ncbi:MAG: hypothetical protein CVU99_16170 [Firmicutes bacterium HGW-Firmicutes-4]|nr:MAG: hypothetical protein CVU99_16170 [Firmicutes bacterium HGW-Firmicutes-4]
MSWLKNVLYVKKPLLVAEGTPQRISVCTRCLRSGKVERA